MYMQLEVIREAARLSGVPIKKIEIIVFTLSGALAAFAGLVLCSRMYSGQPSVGSGYELDAIAACVLGGTSMTGGKGRISGTVFGAMVIGIISNGLNLIGVSSYWQLIIKGLIIACAVLLDCQKDKIALLKNKVRACKINIGKEILFVFYNTEKDKQMEIFRKMSFADSTGDAIPFYHEGKYHIFSLTSPPGTTVYPERLRTTWSHSVSEDLVHWKELPTALYPGEGEEPDASGVWTGSVIYGEGQFHAFYTGYCLTAEFQQTICHATSEDGITWKKDTANPVITPITELYEKLDWRDPYVFYNEEDENYWILISARRLDMPITRRGCIVLYRSKDLKNWSYYGPIYSPGHTNCPECPEMYRMGNHWYLSYSRFSEFVNTIYRVSESPFGPWRKPKKDGIGGRRFYAAKSMQNDDGRRFYFGWAHDRAEQSDKGEWYWGGTFCIPHEVVPAGKWRVKCKAYHVNMSRFLEERLLIGSIYPVLGDAKDIR